MLIALSGLKVCDRAVDQFVFRDAGLRPRLQDVSSYNHVAYGRTRVSAGRLSAPELIQNAGCECRAYAQQLQPQCTLTKHTTRRASGDGPARTYYTECSSHTSESFRSTVPRGWPIPSGGNLQCEAQDHVHPPGRVARRVLKGPCMISCTCSLCFIEKAVPLGMKVWKRIQGI